MPQPGKPQARGEDWLVRKVQELEQKVQQLAAANVFGLTGITPQDGGTQFDGYVNVNGPLTVGGSSTINGPQTVNGSMTIAGSAGVSGPLSVTGTASFTGDTTIGGNATVTGNISKSNSWGTVSLGAAAVIGTPGSASPALTFARSGASFGQSPGVGLKDSSGTSVLTVNGPHTSDPAFLQLASDQTFVLSVGNTIGPSMQGTAGANGSVNLFGGSTNGGVNITSYGTGKCQVYGNFAVTGSKAFIMEHPVNPATMTLMHAATESPVNGVEYWGTATTGTGGTVTVQLPSYFEALTKAGNRNIQLTATGACASVPWASAITAGKFTVNAPAGMKLNWLVKAERQQIVDGYDELSFPVEQDKPLIGPQLEVPGTGY